MLREYIRNLILEIYKLTPEEQAERDALIDPLQPRSSLMDTRALGLQSEDEIIADRKYLADYQKRIQSTTGGKKMISDFMNGQISVCHSPFYEGYAVHQGKKHVQSVEVGVKSSPFSSWIQKYGNRGKDVLSCVAWNDEVGNLPDNPGINRNVLDSIGFYMTGYPVYVSEQDVMSQTLEAIPKGLAQHQKQSGVAKRPGTPNPEWSKYLPYEITGEENWYWAGEVLLDNWEVSGCFIQLEAPGIDYDFYVVSDLVRDALSTGLPVYVFSGGDSLDRVSSMRDVNDGLAELGEKLTVPRRKR